MADQPLPSWNEGPARSAILDFVARVTVEGGPDYVPPSERIATFDNDGTLWCEQPLQSQFFFAFDRLEELARKDPTLRERQPYKAFLERDIAAIHSLGKQAAFEVAFATHSGMTADAFATIARNWLMTARHPKLGVPFTQCVYRPQIELLSYLRANGFKIFIVSGGGIELIRAFAEDNYGVPPEQVIGSSVRLRFEGSGGRADLVRLSELNSFDDREVKPANIAPHIGRRPILAFGNSDGDLAMLRYTLAGNGQRLALLLHHDDEEREFAYDREFRLSPLVEALDKAAEYGITVVGMKRSWKTVFPDGPPPS
ncbi:haloacid dehalogenase-like hydrolase [Microvirga sp. HBU67558]|uniref:HAD family hydrolase n=1 Tax=Microvirga TaxID=186650 RepID=UPI001B370784|nr:MULTISPECIES: HAD family hydrolase [unclassified Microvirga]MBQ0822127.1 haloacid dehalogenase-like hydrolase [Microvirga sp. HBU67558]